MAKPISKHGYYPAEYVEAEVVRLDENGPATLKDAQRRLVAFKFEFLETLNADPRLRGEGHGNKSGKICKSAFSLAAAMLRFVKVDETTWKPTFAYLSTLDARVRTGLSREAIRSARRLLEKHGYWEPIGTSKDGCVYYRVHNPRQEQVELHMREAREVLKEQDAVRKENERRTLKQRGANNRSLKNDEGTAERADRGPLNGPKYLEQYSEIILHEGEQTSQGMAQGNLLPPASSMDEADSILARLCDGLDLPDGVWVYFRKNLLAGTLTLDMIDLQRRMST